MFVLTFLPSFLVLTSFYLHTVGVEVIQTCINVFNQSDTFLNICYLRNSFDPIVGYQAIIQENERMQKLNTIR